MILWILLFLCFAIHDFGWNILWFFPAAFVFHVVKELITSWFEGLSIKWQNRVMGAYVISVFTIIIAILLYVFHGIPTFNRFVDQILYSEYRQDSTENKIDSAEDVVLDTMMTETKELSKKSDTKASSHKRFSSYSYDDDDDDLFNDPEYCEGGKYDPALYHTDYGRDEEARRRRYIDNDGFDDDDGYDEYYGYQHEYERSEQWKK